MANEKRLIDMDDTINKLRAYAERKHEAEHYELANGILKAVNYIRNNIVRVNAVEVVHGWWEPIYEEQWNVTGLCVIGDKCSVCGQEGYHEFNYCPNCGAKMDGERKDNDRN